MFDSVQPHRWQPTRLPGPWDSPGKNTGVGCHFLLQCMKVKSESEVAQSLCLTLCDLRNCSPPGSSVHGDSPGKNTGVNCHALLQGIFYFCSKWQKTNLNYLYQKNKSISLNNVNNTSNKRNWNHVSPDRMSCKGLKEGCIDYSCTKPVTSI